MDQEELFEGVFDKKEDFHKKYWKGMPTYHNVLEAKPEITATFKFRNEKDYQEFKEKVKIMYTTERSVSMVCKEKKRNRLGIL